MSSRRRSAGVRVWALACALALGSCSETVFEVMGVDKVDITSSGSAVPATITQGQVLQLTAVLSAEGKPLNGRIVSWSSNSPAVAFVETEGRLTALSPGSAEITALSEGVTAQISLTVNSAVPSITSLSPPGGPPSISFILTVNGSGFYPGSTVSWNGSARPTTFVTATELRANIPASDVTAPGSGAVTVVNAPPGGASNAFAFSIASVIPAITSVSPTATLPNTAFTLTVSGTGFYNGSSIRWNGSPRTTQFITTTELRALIPASDVAIHGPVQISVVNAPPGGGTSGTASLTVRPVDPCQYLPPHSIGQTVNERIDNTDCRQSDNSYADLYSVTLAAAQQVTFSMTSPTVNSYLFMIDGAGRRIGLNDNTGATVNAALRMMLAAGTYRLYANTTAGVQIGNYTLASQVSPASVTGCAEVWIMSGIQTSGQTVTSNDCQTTSGFYYDEYKIFLVAGARVTIALNADDFDPYLIVRDNSGAPLAGDDDSGPGSYALITFTAPADGVYRIETNSFNPGSTGAYVLIIQ